MQRIRIDLKDFAQRIDRQRSRGDAVVLGQDRFGNDVRAPVQPERTNRTPLKASQHSALL